MTDTTTLGTTPDSEELPELVESERLGSDGTAEDSPLKTRVLLPLLVPILSIVIVAVLVLNISRVFLAGDKDAALATGIFITLAILIGASADRGRTAPAHVVAGDDPRRRAGGRVALRAAHARPEPQRQRGWGPRVP